MKGVLAFPLVRLALIIVLFAVLATPVVSEARSSPLLGAATPWMLVALMFASTVSVERWIARKSLAAVGLGRRDALLDLALGAGLGTLLFSLVAFELFLFGYYRVAAVHAGRGLAWAALLMFGDAAFEELLFRGAIFRLIEEWTGTWIALAVSALLFGLAHAANPHATWLSSLAIAVEAGILLGAAYVVTRNLWFPIGVHFAWNFAEGPIFGTGISGHATSRSALAAHVAGPALVTGGAFGPEAGIPAMVTCVAAAAALLAVVVRRGKAAPPAWRRRAESGAPSASRRQ